MKVMINKAELLNLMKQGAIIITPNNRLSQELVLDFYKINDELVQIKPHCLPYTSFLQSLFQTFCHLHPKKAHPLLLQPHQLQALWQQVLSSNDSLIINKGLIQRVNDAWTRCHAWLLPHTHPYFIYNDQTTLFQSWASELEERLSQLNAISEAQLANYLCSEEQFTREEEKNSYMSSSMSTSLVWACFDDFTPQQKKLKTVLTQKGYQQFYFDLENQPLNKSYLYQAQDEKDELDQLFCWLKERLNKGDNRIGVIVPSLETKAQSLRRAFLQHFSKKQFNISLGEPLASHPLVAHALAWINLALTNHNPSDTISIQQARLLLHSPFLAGAQNEMFARAQFLEDSSLLKQLQVRKSALIKALEPNAPQLASILSKMEAYPEQAPPQTWIKCFINQLKIVGFPGEQALSSRPYQYYQRFMGLLDEFNQLEMINPLMKCNEAIATLNDLAKATIFQPQELNPVPIQVLGLLEAAGYHFESIWVLDLTEQQLPQATKLSAFIPPQLQQQLQMPHATPERELFLAEKMVTRLFNASPHSVFSYPRLQGEKLNRASPLISHLEPWISIENFTPQLLIHSLDNNPSFELVSENYSLPLMSEEKTSGGTALIANQAKCPFKAFAAHRLHAKSQYEITDGLDLKDRGQIIHRIMELFWKEVNSQHYLLKMDEKELGSLLNKIILETLKSWVDKKNISFHPLLHEIEINRLNALIRAEIDWERQRPPFEVEALEAQFKITLGRLELQLRVDRLDKLENGQKEVVDYKSSLPSSLPWNEERPKEPQLLLYALIDEAIQSLFFVALKDGRVACKGLSENAEVNVEGIQSLKKTQTWAELREEWLSHLSGLAEEFIQGQCVPKPLNKSICKNCDYQNLCRYRLDHL